MNELSVGGRVGWGGGNVSEQLTTRHSCFRSRERGMLVIGSFSLLFSS